MLTLGPMVVSLAARGVPLLLGEFISFSKFTTIMEEFPSNSQYPHSMYNMLTLGPVVTPWQHEARSGLLLGEFISFPKITTNHEGVSLQLTVTSPNV